VRVAVTGGTVSPGIYDVLEVMGKDKTIRRIEAAVRAV
jgi:glutamyl-tRNA synthetase